MATADSVKAKIQGLISKANAKTGRSDADMTNAVNALVSGYNPNGITPSGTINITSNGTHNVTNYATANVNVSTGATPTGTINISANGTYDVAKYAQAAVNVPMPDQYSVVRTVTVASDVTGAHDVYTLLSNDDFIKKHYADDGFSALWYPITPVASATNVVHFNYQGNRNIGSSNSVAYGVGYRSSSASSLGLVLLGTKISGTGYGQQMRVNSSGALEQYLHQGYILKAGTYIIVLTCIEDIGNAGEEPILGEGVLGKMKLK